MNTLDAILDMPMSEVEEPQPLLISSLPYPARVEWQHPASEAERVTELESFLAADFNTFREVRIEYRMLLDVPVYGRIDLLAVPKGLDAVLAFEVKRANFDVETALKQSADYVGGHVLEGPHRGKRIAACFLYPTAIHDRRDHEGMFNLIAQWRVGRGFMSWAVEPELALAIGYVVIWRSKRGWTSKARDMLLGKRTVGGSRR